jgi:hypothetical protein
MYLLLAVVRQHALSVTTFSYLWTETKPLTVAPVDYETLAASHVTVVYGGPPPPIQLTMTILSTFALYQCQKPLD